MIYDRNGRSDLLCLNWGFLCLNRGPRSVIPSDGDLDIVIAPRYPSACRGGTWGLSQLWWYGDTLQEIDDILRRDLPKGYSIYSRLASILIYFPF